MIGYLRDRLATWLHGPTAPRISIGLAPHLATGHDVNPRVSSPEDRSLLNGLRYLQVVQTTSKWWDCCPLGCCDDPCPDASLGHLVPCQHQGGAA